MGPKLLERQLSCSVSNIASTTRNICARTYDFIWMILGKWVFGLSCFFVLFLFVCLFFLSGEKEGEKEENDEDGYDGDGYDIFQQK